MQAKIGSSYTHRVLTQVAFSNILAKRVVITGYGDHEDRLVQLKEEAAANARILIRDAADEFNDRFGSDEPIVEIHVRGHADRVWLNGRQNTRDENRVSQTRANDVWEALVREIFTLPTGLVTPQQFFDSIGSGELQVFVVGLGTRFLLKKSSGAAPENRRVEIDLLLKQSIPV